jgi:uncharacterized membrane protein YphA (DoxX/SURF4 family)
MLVRRIDLGRLMIAVGLLGFGTLTLIYDDFGLNWQRVPEWVPARGLLAYAAGAIEVAAAAVLLLKRTSALAAFVLTPYTLLWVLLLDVPPLLSNLGVEGEWLSVGERAELFAGVWILAITLARAQNRATLERFTNDQALRVARIVFGLALIPVGLSHLVYPDAVSFVPAWLPFRMLWLYATGIGHIAAGVALNISVLPRIAAVMEAAMMTSFVLLIHIPRVFASPHIRVEWTMLCIATAFSGAAWSTARSYNRDAWVWWAGRRPVPKDAAA